MARDLAEIVKIYFNLQVNNLLKGVNKTIQRNAFFSRSTIPSLSSVLLIKIMYLKVFFFAGFDYGLSMLSIFDVRIISALLYRLTI